MVPLLSGRSESVHFLDASRDSKMKIRLCQDSSMFMGAGSENLAALAAIHVKAFKGQFYKY